MGNTAIHYINRTLNGDIYTPIVIFKRLNGKKKFLLESSGNPASNGRYSFIGCNPYQEIIGKNDETRIFRNGEAEIRKQKPLEVVKEMTANVTLPFDFPFYGGAIGYMGYDAIRQYENIGRIPEDPVGMPDVHFMFYQDIIVFDHKKQEITILSLDMSGEEDRDALEFRAADIEKQITAEKQTEDVPLAPVTFLPETSKEAFKQMVEAAKEHIKAGDVFQIVLSQRLSAPFHEDAFGFYRKLRTSNPSPYMFYIDFDDYKVLGASPESLIKTTGKTIVTNPIAGSRPRGKTKEADAKLAEELLQDEKELAEHRMLVDLSRNDLGRVSKAGTIEVTKYMTIEKYQHVMHIVSEVQGELREAYTGLDALISALPAGTVSGAPKIRAMQLINEFEQKKRGVYAGAVGYINMNGDLDLALAIRTMVVKDQKAYVQAGAGLVYDSDPETEYQETLNKAKSLTEVGHHDLINR